MDLSSIDLSKKDDTWGISQNDKMHAWFEEHGIIHEHVVTDGGHDWDVWRKDMIVVLPLLFK